MSNLIDEEIKKHKNFMVIKPNCPFCVQAKALLKRKGIPCHEIEFSNSLKIVNEIKNEKYHMTFPMIFLEGEFIGGYDNLKTHLENLENSNNQ